MSSQDKFDKWLEKITMVLRSASYPPPCRSVPITPKLAAELLGELEAVFIVQRVELVEEMANEIAEKK